MQLKIPKSIIEVLRTYARYPKEIGFVGGEEAGHMYGDVKTWRGSVETPEVKYCSYPHHPNSEAALARIFPQIGGWHTHFYTKGFSDMDRGFKSKVKTATIDIVLYWDEVTGHYEEAMSYIDGVVPVDILIIEDNKDFSTEVSLAKRWIESDSFFEK